MILNLIKNLILALLLDAGAALAFGVDTPAATAVSPAPAQSCALPIPATEDDLLSLIPETGAHS